MSADSRWQGYDFVDIGVNLTDDMYKGQYHGKQAHEGDLDAVLTRARQRGVGAQIVTAGSIQDVKDVLTLVKEHNDLYATAGVHPTRTSQVDETYLDDLRVVLRDEAISRRKDGRIVAIGECGLDYDRLHFADKETQKVHFAKQLDLACEFGLPLFLHCRTAIDDFITILRQSEMSEKIAQANETPETRNDAHGRQRIGVAHCFTGNTNEMHSLLDAGVFIGLTGCSFKEQHGIEVAKAVPLERLLLETDAPWCDMRPTHASAAVLAGFCKAHPDEAELLVQPEAVKKEKWAADKLVKSRNEPCTMVRVAAVVAQAKGLDLLTVAKAVRDNSRFLFGI